MLGTSVILKKGKAVFALMSMPCSGGNTLHVAFLLYSLFSFL